MATLTIADLDKGKRDLQTVDAVANSRAATVTTRFGAQTTTLYEAIRRIRADGEAQLSEQKTVAEEVIRNLGFRVPVEYAPGIDVTDSRFTVTGPDGKVYAPLSSPFTAGDWDQTQWYVLQNDLNDHKLLVFNSYVAASAAAATLPDGQVVEELQGQDIYEVKDGALVFKRKMVDAVLAETAALKANPQSSVLNQHAAMRLRYRLRGVNNRGFGYQAQGVAVDLVNGYGYLAQVTQESGLANRIIVSRFRLDGPINQASIDDMLMSINWGHQSLGVQVQGGGVVLWGPSVTPGVALRTTYGATAAEEFVLFPPTLSELTLAVSDDYRYLAARVDQASGNTVRVFKLSDLTVPGDYQIKAISEFRLEDSSFPLQDIHIMGGVLYTYHGDSGLTTNKEIRGYALPVGTRVTSIPMANVGKSDAENTGQIAQGGGNYFEPEGLTSFNGALAPCVISGDLARKATRIYVSDSNYLDWWVSTLFRRIGSGFSLNQLALAREALSIMYSTNLHEKLAHLYILNAVSADTAEVNWCDPYGVGLVKKGLGMAFTAGIGITGSSNLNDYYQVGDQVHGNIVAFDRDRASYGVYMDAAVGLGAAVGSVVGSGATGIVFNPMTETNLMQSALFGDGAEIPISVGNATGLTVVNRTPTSIDVYRGGFLQSTVVGYGTPSGTSLPALGRTATTTSSRQIQAFFMGSMLTASEVALMRKIIRDLVSAFGSVVPDSDRT